jgi:hypothetical protein
VNRIGLTLSNDIYLTFDYLSRYIADRTLKRRNRYPHPNDARVKIIKYSELKDKDKALIPTREELLELIISDETKKSQSNSEISQLSLPEKWACNYIGIDEKYFQDKYNVNYDPAKGNRARDLATGMAILRFIYSNRDRVIRLSNTGFEKMEDLIQAICENLKNRKTKLYGLPTSYSRLRLYYYDYAKKVENGEEPRDILVSERYGNDNAQKFDEIHMAVLKEVYLRTNKPDKYACWNDYRQIMLQEYAMEPVEYSRFKQKCNTNEIRMLAGKVREGREYYEVVIRPFHLRKAPEFNLSLISGDGWEPGRGILHKVKDKDGKIKEVVSTMNVWYWMDWKSTAILGWRISHAESGHDIRQSFRDIMNLHGGYCPRSVMLDKRWAEDANNKRMFEKAGVFIQPKRSYNPKSNLIERLNKEMNKHHRKLDENWVNMTPGYSQANRHNKEAVNLTPMQYDEFVEMITTIFNTHNNVALKNLNGKTPLEDLYSNINPECKVFNEIERLWIFGQKRIETVYNNNTFKIQIASKKYQFVLPEDHIASFIKRDVKYNKVRVYFDEKFMETADIYEFSDENDDTFDRYICTCQNADSIRYTSAQVEMKDDDWTKFHKQQKRAKIVDEYIKKDLEEKEQILDATNFDRASVYKVSQEKYKEANSTEMGKMYTQYYEEVENEETLRKAVVTVDKSKKNHKEKYNKLKGSFDEFNQ